MLTTCVYGARLSSTRAVYGFRQYPGFRFSMKSKGRLLVSLDIGQEVENPRATLEVVYTSIDAPLWYWSMVDSPCLTGDVVRASSLHRDSFIMCVH